MAGIAQKADTYQWFGGSGEWSNARNWMKDGKISNTVPSPEDRVFFQSGTNAITVLLTADINVGAVYTSGKGLIEIQAKKGIDFSVNGSFVLSPQTEIDDNVNIALLGLNEHSYLQLSPKINQKISFGNKSKYKKLDEIAKSGGCPFFTIVPNPTPPTCNGFEDGIASVSEPMDGVGPYTYQWIGGPSTQQWTNLGAGTYTVIVMDVGQGLPCNVDVFVNEPGPLSVFDMNASPPLCADVCNGTSSPIVIGGNGGYSFTWSSGETGSSASMLCPVFTLQIEDQAGCIADTTFTFPNTPDTIKFDAAITNIDCFGDDDGAIDVSISGGTGAFSPSWTGPNGFTATTEDIAGLEPGNYTISVTDGNNCLADSTFAISENPPLTATTVKTDNVCADEAGGDIELNPAGGSGVYTFAWTGPNGFTATTQNLTGLESGLYEVTITDDALCTFTTQVTIDEPAPINVSFTSDDILCAGDTSGTASATASGGTPGYTYSWAGPGGFSANGPGITNLSAGSYVVTVSDANSCLKLDSVSILQPDSLLLDLSSTAITCHNGADGSIDLQISGGMAPYSVLWSGPAGFSSTDTDIANLQPGAYSVSVTDANNCVASANETLDNPAAIMLNGVITNSTCANGNTGEIDLTVNGGTAPFDFEWTGPAGFSDTNEDISNLSPGTYSVVVTDDAGCVANGLYEVDAPDALSATFVTENASCFGVSDGSIQMTPQGGIAPYSFLWVGPSGFISTDQDNFNLEGGSYTVQITDANGCAGFMSVSISQPPKINIANTITDVQCFGESTGEIDILVSGGSPGYTFSWVGPDGFSSAQADINGLTSGVYTITVTDAIGCSKSRDLTVTQPNEITIDSTINDVVCADDANGSISITVNDGVPPYSYTWSGPGGFTSTDPDISNLVPGDYHLTVTDANACTVSQTFNLTHTVVITVDATSTNLSCFESADGAIDVAVSGGQEPYQINWTGPGGFTSTDLNITDLIAGNYSLGIIDDNGCELTQNYTISQPPVLAANLLKTDIVCAGDDNGSLSANLTGGTTPYTVSWTGPDGFTSANADINGLSPGEYFLSVVDNNNCTLLDSAVINSPDSILVDILVTQPGCVADDGELSANVTGGVVTTDYTYEWLNAGGNIVGTTSTISNLPPGEYTLNVTDDNGCSVQEVVDLTRITFNVAATLQSVSCNNAADGSITVTPTSGTPPFTFAWTGPGGFTSTDPALSNLAAGDYFLEVADDAGCLINLSYEVSQPGEILANALITPVACLGESNGAIELNISGGNPGYSVSWIGPDAYTGTGTSIIDLDAGAYTAAITDVNGCTKDTTVVLDPGFDFTLSFTASDPACANEASGNIDVEASPSGGSTTYTYAWTGPNGFTSSNADISNLLAGSYALTVLSDGGCSKQDTVELINPDPVLLDVTVANSTCLQADGGAGVNVSGGSIPYTINWLDAVNDTIATGDTLQNVSAGLYTVLVADAAGCEISEVVTISDDAGGIDGTVTNPVCHNGSDGEIDITIVNGNAPYTYEWTDGATIISNNEDIDNLSPGDYTVLVTDDAGCSYSESFEVENPGEILAAVSQTGISCLGNDGEIDLSISGGQEPYTVTWTGPDGYTGTGQSIAGLEIGTYYFDIVDANMCAGSDSVELELIPSIVLDADITDIICGGDSTGAVATTVSGGVQPYSFVWSGPNGFESSNQSISGVIAGDYTLTVTDAANCVVTQTYSVTENPPLTVDFTIVNPDCTTDNGSISAAISGGVIATDYFIQWTDEDGNALPAQADLTGLGIGSYDFEVADDNGCAFDTTIVLSNPGADISANIGHLNCANDSSGTIDLTVLDVDEPFTVSWTGPNGYTENGIALTDLIAGEYDYTVTGADGCTYTGSTEVLQPDSLLATAEILKACFGEASGAIEITITGGNPAYTVSWTGPDGFTSSDEDLTGLIPGIYTLSITDENGCSFNSDYEVVENTEIDITAAITEITCHGDSTGAIDLSVSGGMEPYLINWLGPNGFTSLEDSISNLVAGEYMLSLTDSLGCISDTLFILSEPDSISVEENVISAGCSSANSDGSIELIVSGGTPVYAVDWSGPGGFTANTMIIENLDPGIYTYLITDNAGCQVNRSVEVFDVEPLEVSLTAGNVNCFGEANGSVSAVVTGGLAPYTYAWTGTGGFSSDSADIEDLPAGAYTLLVSDSAGCSAGATVEITQPDSIAIDLNNFTDASCSSSADGTVNPEVSGGTAPLDYTWTGPDGYASTNTDLDDLAPGVYELTITDALGCSNTAQVNIGFMLEVSADAGIDQSVCASDLPLEIIGTGMNVDEFTWTNTDGDTLSTESTLSVSAISGSHTYILTGGNGICSITDTVTIDILSNPEVDAGPDQEVFADELFTLGGIPVSPTGETYQWTPNPGGGFDASAPNPSGALSESTTFVVEVADANGCVGRDTVFIEVLPDLNVTSGFTPNDDGINDSWVIDNIELFPNNVVQIFDRWGIVLYSQQGYNSQNAWDGTYEGKPLPVGTYYYTIELKDSRFPDPITGPLTIYR